MGSHIEVTKLAKLVGVEKWTELGTPMVPSYEDCEWEHYRQWNPLVNADDDYAVLEWMRATCNNPIDYQAFQFSLPDDAIDYSIGDYARAALKVLETGE